MNRPNTHIAATFVRDLPIEQLTLPWRQLIPLWRVAVVGAMILLLAGMHLWVRMESTQLTRDIRGQELRARAAATAHEQLMLDLETRRGHAQLRRAADALGLVAPERTVRVREAAR